MIKRSVIKVIGGKEWMATRVQMNEKAQIIIARTMEVYNLKDLNIWMTGEKVEMQSDIYK